MSDIQLPSEWRETTLECVGVVVTGKTPSKKNPDFFSGTIPFIKPGDVNDQGVITHTEEHLTDLGAATVPTIPLGAVVVTCIGNLGRCAITSELSATNQQINSVIPDSGVNVSFIYYQLRTLKEWMLSESSATTVTIINKSKFSQAPIVLPPLAEQIVIADKLDTLLAQVETTKARLERIPEILKRFRQSVLSAAVSGKLTEEWREANACVDDVLNNIQAEKKHWIKNNPMHNEVKRVVKRVKEYSSRPDVTELDLPETWSSSHLEDCVLMIVDCHNKTAPYSEVGNPLIRTSNIRDGKFVWENLKFVSDETYEFWSRRCPPESGDIIFTREAPMGEAAIVPAESKLCLGQRTMLIRPIEKFVSAKFLLMSFMDPNFRKRSEEIAVGTGVKHYRVGDVSNLVLGVPPTNEQLQIVNQVEELFAFADSIEQKARAALARVNNLTQSILAKAFRGELTADWRAANPELISGDNSAAALLEKINTERQTSKPVRKVRAKISG